MAPKSDLLQGTLDLLILKTLAPAPCTAGASRCASSRSRATCCRSTRDRSTPRSTGSSSRG